MIERGTRSLILDFLQEKFEENELSQMDNFGLTKDENVEILM